MKQGVKLHQCKKWFWFGHTHRRLRQVWRWHWFGIFPRLDFGHTLGKRNGLQLEKNTLGRGDFRTILENSSMSFSRNTFVATPHLLGTVIKKSPPPKKTHPRDSPRKKSELCGRIWIHFVKVDVEECPSFLVFRRAFVMHCAFLGECFVCDTTMWRRKSLGFLGSLVVFGACLFWWTKWCFSISGRFVR